MKIKAQDDVKLKRHSGYFTASYFVAKAIYDYQIRNWEIIPDGNNFIVQDSNKHQERVYLNHNISNCSCLGFYENQVGTCMHIEAIYDQDLESPRIRPITYVSDSFELRNINGPGWETPAVLTYRDVKAKRSILPSGIQVQDYTLFDGIIFFDFQKESIQRMLDARRCVLTLKMGLGKTLCALYCAKLLDSNKIIIVCPNNLKRQWQREIRRFNLGTTFVVDSGKDLINPAFEKFVIVSYEMLNRNPEFLKQEFDIAIIDEIQKIKNPESVTWKTISNLKSDFLFALSGSPIENSVQDLISIINIINPYELKPIWKFYDEFCEVSRAKILGIKEGTIQALLKRIGKYLINPVIDYSKLPMPDPNPSTHHTKMDAKQSAIHDGFMDQARPLLAKSFQYPLTFGEKARLNALLLKSCQASIDTRLLGSDDKSERFSKIEAKILELKDKSITIYSQWIKCLDLLKPFLEQNNILYAEFNGKIPSKKRDKNLRDFIERKIQILLSTDSGGVGIDGLQLVCNHVIHVESVWNPKRIDQRNGRFVRNLQKEPVVNIFYFKTASDIEDLMQKAVIRKNKLFKDIIEA